VPGSSPLGEDCPGWAVTVGWQAATVTWHPWDETGESVWVHTQVTIRAGGESLTILLKGYHPFAAQGGATLFDNVQVMDLGP